MDRCAECGFEYRLEEAPAAGAAIVSGAGEIATILTGGALGLRTRRQANEWSPLEYTFAMCYSSSASGCSRLAG